MCPHASNHAFLVKYVFISKIVWYLIYWKEIRLVSLFHPKRSCVQLQMATNTTLTLQIFLSGFIPISSLFLLFICNAWVTDLGTPPPHLEWSSNTSHWIYLWRYFFFLTQIQPDTWSQDLVPSYLQHHIQIILLGSCFSNSLLVSTMLIHKWTQHKCPSLLLFYWYFLVHLGLYHIHWIWVYLVHSSYDQWSL